MSRVRRIGIGVRLVEFDGLKPFPKFPAKCFESLVRHEWIIAETQSHHRQIFIDQSLAGAGYFVGRRVDGAASCGCDRHRKGWLSGHRRNDCWLRHHREREFASEAKANRTDALSASAEDDAEPEDRSTLSAPRADFEEQAKKIGFRFASIDGERYWDESVRYVFSMREIEKISKSRRPTSMPSVSSLSRASSKMRSC